MLLGGLIVIWGAAVFSLTAAPGGWAHAALYVAVAVLIPALVPWVVQGLSALQRSRLRAMLGAEIPAPVRPLGAPGTSSGTSLLALFTGLAGGLLVPPVPRCSGAGPVGDQDRREDGPDAARARPPRGAGAASRDSLAATPANLVAAADAERRRIERDLHDGAQQRLVSLAMNLGMARERSRPSPNPSARPSPRPTTRPCWP